MNLTQALARVRKVLGPKAGIRDSKRPSSPEWREQARAVRHEVAERKRAAYEAMNARRDALLAADAEFQRLRGEYEAAKDAHGNTPWPEYYRYDAGRVGALFFSVEASADNLAELVEKIEAKGKS